MPVSRRRRQVQHSSQPAGLPEWIPPQLTLLVEATPTGDEWAHEIKLDGYRMQARLDRGQVRLLTRTGLDWTHKYPSMAQASAELHARQAYIDGELCALAANGVTSFSLMQAATDGHRTSSLVYFAFDLLYVDGENLMQVPLVQRKQRLKQLLGAETGAIRYCDHQIGRGPEFYQHGCKLKLEGVVSKRLDAPYVPNDRGLWLKTKCLNREEFIIVGWTDPEGSRPRIGALLVAYYDPDGRLTYAGRAATGMSENELERVWRRLQPLKTPTMPLEVPPPRTSRFGSPLVLSRVHWGRPELVVEVKYLTWTLENLLRQVVYVGLREDKPAREVQRPVPFPKATASVPISTRKKAPHIGVPRENILQLLPDAVVPSREELAQYWTKVAPHALRYLGNRPLKLVRHMHGTTFYHRGALPPVPSSVHQLRLTKREGGQGVRLWVDSLDGLLGLVEVGVVEMHPWGATVDDIERPDTLVFDLDPGEGVEWSFVADTAFALKDLVSLEGLDCWPKLTGGKGIHLMVPIERSMLWDPAHVYAKRLADTFIERDRRRYTLSASPSSRSGKLFIDYLRNGRGTTAVGAWSPRARPTFPIAAPISWADVRRGIRPYAFTIEHPPNAA